MNEEHSKEAQWLLKEKYAGTQTPEFFEDLKRLEAGQPLAYVIGWMPFLNTKIFLDSHPLIPRTETEHWVEGVVSTLKQTLSGGTPLRILDLCAGSGAIGIALLRSIPNAHVDFIEIDRLHHMTILRNLAENHIDQRRAQVLGGDLFEKAQGPYDYIFSNPPYIDPEKSDRVQESVKMHEPALALYGGEKGLEIIYRIIREAPTHLTSKGTLYIEHEPEQAEYIERYAEKSPYRSAATLTDQYGVLRVTAIQKA